MKFAKELEEDLVPEWRVKYFNYKLGKKKIKAVARALRNVNQTPKITGHGSSTPNRLPYTQYDFSGSHGQLDRRDAAKEPLRNAAPFGQGSRPDHARRDSTTRFMASPPMQIPEREPLKIPRATGRGQENPITMYGSIIASPPQRGNTGQIPALDLPDAAVNPNKAPSNRFDEHQENVERSTSTNLSDPASDAYHVGATHAPPKAKSFPKHIFRNRRTRTSSSQDAETPGPLRRMFSLGGAESPVSFDVNLAVYRELDAKQDDFFSFLDKELDKIETFYRMKEQEATDRLHILREQLHEMRDRRLEDMIAEKHAKQRQESAVLEEGDFDADNSKENGNGFGAAILHPIEFAINRKPRYGKTTKAMEHLGSPSKPKPVDLQNRRDYVRRATENQHVPYRSAKRKLKLALQEFYRGLELLKSYAVMNRTAFRKANKKYDKAVNARPTGRYMTEKVNKAYFVESDVIEGHIVAVEDLYTRYFERGNHKLAVSKLRSKSSKLADYSANTFRSGLLLAAGTVLAIQGLVNAADLLASSNPNVGIYTNYLLQLYGGYFLGLLLFLIFVLDCRFWIANKINYIFVFEYDSREVLDWRQLAEIPCLFYFLEGLFLWLNFRQTGMEPWYLYWPVVLFAVTVLIMALPFPILYHRSRKWWGFSNWRLALAGIYPVEFRDFFLGDQYCSETYTMGNVALFFCLYTSEWANPGQCNSSHSRLQGFFAALPGIWRLLQCLRRYYDSRNWFPHLANAGKYSFNVVYAMTLSLYRIHKSTEIRALFIALATINATYASIWDLVMDWSLGNPYAKHPFLRDNLGYQQIWIYYAAMILDPILRFGWIFYMIYENDLQHAALLSFILAVVEVLRRGMWTIFRVENEHCTNVGKFRASRDIALPYSLPSSPSESEESHQPKEDEEQHMAGDHRTTATDLEATQSAASKDSLRLRNVKSRAIAPPTPSPRVLQRVGNLIHDAHAQDFQRKKRPEIESMEGKSALQNDGSSEDDEDEEEEDHNYGHMDPDDEEIIEAERLLSRGRE